MIYNTQTWGLASGATNYGNARSGNACCVAGQRYSVSGTQRYPLGFHATDRGFNASVYPQRSAGPVVVQDNCPFVVQDRGLHSGLQDERGLALGNGRVVYPQQSYTIQPPLHNGHRYSNCNLVIEFQNLVLRGSGIVYECPAKSAE